MNESELLNNIRNNSSEFSIIFNLYYKPIFGYIFRRTGEFDDTADIASNTFLKAFRHINKFEYKGISIKVWLYRIANNEINQYFRFRKKRNTVLNLIEIENRDLFKNYVSEDRKEIETELKKNEQFSEIQKSLKTLPVKYQEVISLRYFEGKNNKEIAEILNIKEGTLKSLLSRGVSKIKNICNRN